MVMNQIAARGDWRLRLAKDYAETANRLASAYARILPVLRERAGEFANELAALEDFSGIDVKKLNSYQKLLLATETELRDFAVIARNQIGDLQGNAITEGIASAFDMTQASAGRFGQVVGGIWNQPDPAALERLINYVDGSAMRDKFAKFGVNAAENLGNVILSGVAQGKNPRDVAQLMKAWFGVPYDWAETTARTTQLYSYRSATHAAYKANSDVVQGWMWWSAADTATCISCWSKHGQKFSNDETLNDHHRGRCTPIPIVKGTRWADSVVIGPDRFDRLPVREQRQIMGKAMWEAYNDKKLNWNDFSVPYQNSVFGEMLTSATLQDLVGENEAKKYYSISRRQPPVGTPTIRRDSKQVLPDNPFTTVTIKGDE